MKIFFLILFYSIFSFKTLAQGHYSTMTCSLGNNIFKITYDDQIWKKEIQMWPWSIQQMECGRNAAAAVVDNNFLFFSLKKNRISSIKLNMLNNENIQLKVGDDVAVMVVDNYLRVESSKSTYEHYFDSLERNSTLSISGSIAGIVYGSAFVVAVHGKPYIFKWENAATSADKLLNASYGFAVKRGNIFLVFDKYKLAFKSMKVRVSGTLKMIRRVPIYIQNNGEKIIYNSRTGTFDLDHE